MLPLSVEITPASASGAVGATVTLVAIVRNANGEIVGGVHVAWSSSDNTIAAITHPAPLPPSLTLTVPVALRKTGTATITATAYESSGTATLVVA